MTHVEKMRFQAALQALRGTNPVLFPCLLSKALTSTLPQRRAKQRRRGPSECLRAARVQDGRMDNQKERVPHRGAYTRQQSHANTRPGPLLRLRLVLPWRQLLPAESGGEKGHKPARKLRDSLEHDEAAMQAALAASSSSAAARRRPNQNIIF